MRIVDVTQWYAPQSGGIRTYLHAKAAWASRVGVRHSIVVPGPTDGTSSLVESPVNMIRGWSPTKRWGYRIALRRGPVLRTLEALEPDVVVIHDCLAFPASIMAWAATRGVPTALFCHALAATTVEGSPRVVEVPVGRILERALRRALVGPDVVFVGTEGMAAEVRPMTSAPVVVAPLGVDVETFARAKPDPYFRAMAGPGRSLLLYAGRLSPEKRVSVLPEMMSHLTDPATLVIAGDGVSRAGIERAIAARGLQRRIRLLGHIPDRARLASLMATADCFVHPNPREPFGLAPLEALAAGCRVVAPASGGSAEALAGTGALLVDPSAASLAAGISQALRTPRQPPALGDRSWERTFEIEAVEYARLLAGDRLEAVGA